MAEKDPTSDHDLLTRIDERTQASQGEIGDLKKAVELLRVEVITLKVAGARHSALYGALSGLVAALFLSLAVAGIQHIGAAVPR